MVLFRKITSKEDNRSLKYLPDVKINLKVAEYKNVSVNEFNNVVKFNDGEFPNLATLPNSVFSRAPTHLILFSLHTLK